MSLHPLTVLLSTFDLKKSRLSGSGVGGCPSLGGSHMDALAEWRTEVVSSRFSSHSSFKRRKQHENSHTFLSRGNRYRAITGWALAILPSAWLVSVMSQPGSRIGHHVCVEGLRRVAVPCPGWGTGVGAGQALDVFPCNSPVRWQLESRTCSRTPSAFFLRAFFPVNCFVTSSD